MPALEYDAPAGGREWPASACPRRCISAGGGLRVPALPFMAAGWGWREIYISAGWNAIGRIRSRGHECPRWNTMPPPGGREWPAEPILGGAFPPGAGGIAGHTPCWGYWWSAFVPAGMNARAGIRCPRWGQGMARGACPRRCISAMDGRVVSRVIPRVGGIGGLHSFARA
jgi:hypothetical protein